MTDGDGRGRRLRVLVVDEHEIVRRGVVAVLDRSATFEVVAEADSAAGAVTAALAHAPDLVVMDLRLPDGSGIDACREIRAANAGVRVVILTGYPDEHAVLSAVIGGADGYLLKQVRGRDLVRALEIVGRGGSLLEPAVVERVLERVRRAAAASEPEELAYLTQQERRILLLVADGLTNKEIGRRIFLSDKTVKNYVSSILGKLGVQRRSQAAALVAARHVGAAPSGT